MKIIVTGATGFVGRHVVDMLYRRGHVVTAVARSKSQVELFNYPSSSVKYIFSDIYTDVRPILNLISDVDSVIHLAWAGLPNYNSISHITENLVGNFSFISSLISAGCRQILITGTCLEYGMQYGALTEDAPTFPNNPYALAKDTLRKSLDMMRKNNPFCLQWARLFYMYGQGQNPRSLIAQLDHAIDTGQSEFLMSGGEQLRDYLSVSDVSEMLVNLFEHPEWDGITNVCSGAPISVRSLVEQHIAMRGAQITLRLGAYPYPDYEPMAFWGASCRSLK